MTMVKVSVDEMKRIAEIHGLKPCRIRGTSVVNIRKNPSDKFEDIAWEEFQTVLSQRGLAVYKASESDYLKIMKDRPMGVA
jgi:hypothetical protein